MIIIQYKHYTPSMMFKRLDQFPIVTSFEKYFLKNGLTIFQVTQICVFHVCTENYKIPSKCAYNISNREHLKSYFSKKKKKLRLGIIGAYSLFKKASLYLQKRQ